MSYPNICTDYCARFGTDECPNSADCMVKRDKPFFKPKHVKRSWLWQLWMKRKHKKYCRKVGYNCPDCIYHKWVWDEDGITFRGNACQWGRFNGAID